MSVEDRIEAIEKELSELKAIVMAHKRRRVVKLRGILKGLDISKKDIEEAKKSLFKYAYD